MYKHTSQIQLLQHSQEVEFVVELHQCQEASQTVTEVTCFWRTMEIMAVPVVCFAAAGWCHELH